MSKPQKARADLYQEVTDRIVEAMEQGRVPWRNPWDKEKAGGSMLGPQNAVTGKGYRGINVLLLGMSKAAFETGDPRWATFKQAKEQGWTIKEGSKASSVMFYKAVEVEDRDAAAHGEEGKMKTVPVLRSFPVFHASQIEGIPAFTPPSVEEAPWRKPEATETILANSGAVLKEGGDRAFYSVGTDHIQLPPAASFNSAEDWSATALHELGHWTGAPHRLNRDLTGRFGSGAYAQEELRAELASVMIGAELGVTADIPNHASYLSSWLKALKEDKREIFRAAGDAQRMADYALGFHPEYVAKNGLDPTPRSEHRPASSAAEKPKGPDFGAAVSADRPEPLRGPDFSKALQELEPEPAAGMRM